MLRSSFGLDIIRARHASVFRGLFLGVLFSFFLDSLLFSLVFYLQRPSQTDSFGCIYDSAYISTKDDIRLKTSLTLSNGSFQFPIAYSDTNIRSSSRQRSPPLHGPGALGPTLPRHLEAEPWERPHLGKRISHFFSGLPILAYKCRNFKIHYCLRSRLTTQPAPLSYPRTTDPISRGARIRLRRGIITPLQSCNQEAVKRGTH